MLSYKLDFSSCVIMPGFGKSSHIYPEDEIIALPVNRHNYCVSICNILCGCDVISRSGSRLTDTFHEFSPNYRTRKGNG